MTTRNAHLNTVEIPREEWEKALLTVSECLHGETTRVWVEGLELGNQPLAQERPLMGLSIDEKGSSADSIVVSLGTPGKHEITHLIQAPERLYIQEDEQGRTLCVWVQGADKIETLVCFEHGHAPEPGVRSLKLASRK